MDLDDFNLLPGGRSPAHFVGGLGMGDEHRAGLDAAGDPGAADVAFAELVRAFGVAGDERLRGGRNEEAIDHARQAAEPHVEPGPLQRGAIGQDLAVEVAVKRRGGRVFSRVRVKANAHFVFFHGVTASS